MASLPILDRILAPSCLVLIRIALLGTVIAVLASCSRNTPTTQAALTVEIDRLRQQIETREAQLAAQAADVTRLHQTLTLRRTALKKDDQVALEAYNAEVATYESQNAKLKSVQTLLGELRQELTATLEERTRLVASGADPDSRDLIMYTRDGCSYCDRAKAYFAERKISYIARDVARDPAALEKFHSAGGTGVPLFVRGKQKMSGFSPAAMDGFLDGDTTRYRQKD